MCTAQRSLTEWSHGFLTQLTTQVLPLFEIPNSAMRFVVIALAGGFPIAMLLSWLYELAPEGIAAWNPVAAEAARAWLPPFGACFSAHGSFIRMGQGMTEVQTRYQSNFRLATDIESGGSNPHRETESRSRHACL